MEANSILANHEKALITKFLLFEIRMWLLKWRWNKAE
jgi:hypothetical protein